MRASSRQRRKFVTVYWLIPAKSHRELFRKLIHILAEQFDAPRFGPHLTLLAAPELGESPRKILRQLKASKIRLRVQGIGWSSKFTKTFFVRFHSNASLEKLAASLAGAKAGALPIPDPHLSLLYQKLPTRTKKELGSAIKLPFREVIFDSIQAAKCPSPTLTAADVKSWRILATKFLR